jgi:hypothetical protein
MKGTVVMRFVGNRQEPEEEPVKTNDILFMPPLFDEWWEDFMQREVDRMKIACGLQVPIGKLE